MTRKREIVGIDAELAAMGRCAHRLVVAGECRWCGATEIKAPADDDDWPTHDVD